MSTEFRHEYKYRLDARQEAVLQLRARGLMQLDPHVGESGSYYIRSLYLDSPDDECFSDNEDGCNHRSKFRIRRYDDNTEFIRLEKKSKINGMCKKESCALTREECQDIMDGKYFPINMDMPVGKQKLLAEMEMRRLRPKVVVSYERVPYICQGGNVRVTFDKALSSSGDVGGFLAEPSASRLIFPRGESLLEVKWDELLPGYIYHGLSMDTLSWTGFSKYYLCRYYNCGGRAVMV